MVVMRPAAKGGTKFYHSNGAWEMSPILDEGKEYVVLASAEGFQARPEAYRIYALNGKAFRIEGGV